MFRNVLVLVGLLSLVTTADVFAASPFDSFRDPNHKILPGHHHPIHRRYGHHGVFHNGFLGMHNRTQTSVAGHSVGKAKKHRGTL